MSDIKPFTKFMNESRKRKGLKEYYPKLSNNILKSCKGCALTQELICTTGYKDGGVKHRKGNSSMFYGNPMKCDLGFRVFLKDDSHIPVPKEKCPKPKTKFEYLICQTEISK